jgi:chemotaxis protein methyltransferase CheR
MNRGNCKRRDAESIGLIVTELLINSLKHAFDETTKDGEIKVSYDVSGTDWRLAVSDNGFGKPDGLFAQPKWDLVPVSSRRCQNSLMLKW